MALTQEQEKELKKIIDEARKVWPILQKLAPYKNKTWDDYENYITRSYLYYQSLSEDDKKEFNKVKERQFKHAIDAIDNRKKEIKNESKRID